jgi:hypothetical protein
MAIHPGFREQARILIVVVCLAFVFAAATVWWSGQWSAAIVLIALIGAAATIRCSTGGHVSAR